MAGKRQHYIPQALQRGFVRRWRGQNAYTCVYRKGAEPFETNIKNAAVESHFYVDPDGEEADSQITQREGEYGALLNHLRAYGSAESVDSEKLAELVAHFEIRTRSLRENFKHMAGYMASEFFRVLEEPGMFEQYLRRELDRNPDFLDEPLGEQLREKGIPQEQIDVVLSNRDALFEFALPQIRNGLAQTARELRTELPGILETSLRKGHVSALQRSLSPESKIARYRNLVFSVVDTGSVRVPLGDTITVFVTNKGESISSFYDGSRDVDCLLIPVSEKQILIGRSSEYSPKTRDIPALIVRVSFEQFIAAGDTPEYRRLAEEIGNDAYLLSTDELLRIVWETLGASNPNTG